jgi:ABC-type dipeptide/oligopeptide/nickel transport system ATPase subunit
VFGGISGSTKTTLNTNLSGTQESTKGQTKIEFLRSCFP